MITKILKKEEKLQLQAASLQGLLGFTSVDPCAFA